MCHLEFGIVVRDSSKADIGNKMDTMFSAALGDAMMSIHARQDSLEKQLNVVEDLANHQHQAQLQRLDQVANSFERLGHQVESMRASPRPPTGTAHPTPGSANDPPPRYARLSAPPSQAFRARTRSSSLRSSHLPP